LVPVLSAVSHGQQINSSARFVIMGATGQF
jgi:hypothetical protein